MTTPRLPPPAPTGLRPGRKAAMCRLLAGLALPAMLAGCAVYPDGSLGPLPAAPVAAYPAPAYGYGDGYPPPPPTYYAPPPPVYYAPPPVVVAPTVGLGFNWGGRGYYGRHHHHRRW